MSQSLPPHKPHWGWSSLVLLSTLLLSPVAATGFLHALAQALPQAFGPAQTSQLPAVNPVENRAANPAPVSPQQEDNLPRAQTQPVSVSKTEPRRFPAVVFAWERKWAKAELATPKSFAPALPSRHNARASLSPRAPPVCILAS